MFSIEDILEDQGIDSKGLASRSEDVADLIAAQSTDIKNEVSLEDRGLIAWATYGREIKVWDNAPYGQIIDRFTKNYIDYVIVMFDHPHNPPSNNIEYIYLAPEG